MTDNELMTSSIVNQVDSTLMAHSWSNKTSCHSHLRRSPSLVAASLLQLLAGSPNCCRHQADFVECRTVDFERS